MGSATSPSLAGIVLQSESPSALFAETHQDQFKDSSEGRKSTLEKSDNPSLKKPSVTTGASGNQEPAQVTTQNGSKFMTLPEACAFLEITKKTMYRLLKDGLVPAFKYEGSHVWKFDRGQLELWLKEQQSKRGRQ